MAHANLKNDTYKLAKETLMDTGSVRIVTGYGEIFEITGTDRKQQEVLRAIFIESYESIDRIERMDNMNATIESESIIEQAMAAAENSEPSAWELEDGYIRELAEKTLTEDGYNEVLKGELLDEIGRDAESIFLMDEMLKKMGEESVQDYISKRGQEILAVWNAKMEAEVAAEQTKKTAKKTPKREKPETVAVGGISLTSKQAVFIQTLPKDDFYEDGLDSVIWSDIYCERLDNMGIMGKMSGGAMITTLREKGLLKTGTDKVNGRKASFFEFTDLGKEIAGKLGLK